jgi:periplasmic protein TonB
MEKSGGKKTLNYILALSFATVAFFNGSTEAKAQTDQVLFVAQEMPTFPGGDKALIQALYKNLKYPEEAFNNNIEGKVLVKFVITKDGSVTNASVTRSADPSLDKAALEAIKKLPKFIPGKQDGKPVDVWYSLPIVFKKSQE